MSSMIKNLLIRLLERLVPELSGLSIDAEYDELMADLDYGRDADDEIGSPGVSEDSFRVDSIHSEA